MGKKKSEKSEKTERSEKLIIQSHRYTGETTVVSVRLPRDMILDLDAAAERSNRTRSEIIVMGLEFALQNMEIL